MSLVPPVCAKCRRPLGTADAAFCDVHWPLLSTETRRRYVRARNAARRVGRPSKDLLLAVRRGLIELASLATLTSDEG